jgi:sulfite reductase (NADPH) flavoprotein alpha-component
MSLTGLQWSYEWYKNGLISITGAQPGRARGDAEVGREHGQAVHWDQGTLEAVWSGFLNEVGADGRFHMAIIDLPAERAETLSVRYLDPEPRHDRAYNTVEVRIADGRIASHIRYDEKAFGDRFMASIFPLHSGRHFGIVGVIVFMVASLAMPLFAITGWMLYLARRQQKKRVRMQVPGEGDLGVGATRPDIALEVDG